MRTPYPGRLGRQAINNHHLNACRLELAQEQDLMRTSARQAVRRLDVQTIDASICNQLAQAIQARTSQPCAATAVINELSLSWHPELIFQNLDAQSRQLIGDGQLVCRGASVHRHT
jgi:hypothetical protein